MKRLYIISTTIVFVFSLFITKQAKADVTSYTSGFQVQNLENSTATISIQFYDSSGNLSATVNDTILANQSKTYYPLTAVPSGFKGSVVISSDKKIAAIANVLGNNGVYGSSYVGFTIGSSPANIPLVMKNNYGISTWFSVQNVGSSPTTINITYAGTSCTESYANLPPNTSKTFDQKTNTCLPNGHVGAATVTSTGSTPIAVTVLQVTDSTAGLKPGLLAYNGFTSSSTNPIMPLVSSGYYKSGTGIQVMNTGSSNTTVTITYTPSAGFPGNTCTETKTIPAGQSVTFGFPLMPSGCYTNAGGAGSAAFVGSASVTGNSTNQPLVAVVNQVTIGTSRAAAYSAFDPSTATDKVSLPLIMDRNYGIFTGFSVANVGGSPTTITCTFTGTGAPSTVSASVNPGQALTHVQLNTATTVPYVGSATCTGANSSDKIVAVVNQLNTGSVIAAEDGLLVYEGINY